MHIVRYRSVFPVAFDSLNHPLPHMTWIEKWFTVKTDHPVHCYRCEHGPEYKGAVWSELMGSNDA